MLYEDLTLEKNLSIDAEEENNNKILDTFQLSDTTHLPVVKDVKIIGILDLFTFTKSLNIKKKFIEMIDRNIVVAKENDNISDYHNLKQKILPFVNKVGLYKGFIKKETIEDYLQNKKHKQEIQYYKDLKEEFDAIFHHSSDGIFIADGKGITLRLNPAGERIEEVNATEIVGKHVRELVEEGLYSESATLKVLETQAPVTILQKVRNGKEVIVTGTPIFKNGKLFRIVNNSRNITELNTLKKALSDVHQLAEKYHSELELLRLEQIQIDDIIVSSPKMKKILTLAKKVASVDSTVLIQGESGVGKGDISKLIHRNSKRNKGPFIKIDCGAIPESLLESELFGYEKGAFTTANKEGKLGLIEFANEGTLFLDEIGELPLKLQVKLLRVLQDREIFRVGGKKPVPVDIRIIAATNRDLKVMVQEKTFREDLYYRLNVVPIYIPPLRERKKDIEPLIMNCLNIFNKKYELKKIIKPEVIECLIKFNWPGNVRELENTIEFLIVTTATEVIGLEDLPYTLGNNKLEKRDILTLDYSLSFKEIMDQYEKNLLLSIMEQSKSTQEMSNILKLDPSTITRKLKKHKINIPFQRMRM